MKTETNPFLNQFVCSRSWNRIFFKRKCFILDLSLDEWIQCSALEKKNNTFMCELVCVGGHYTLLSSEHPTSSSPPLLPRCKLRRPPLSQRLTHLKWQMHHQWGPFFPFFHLFSFCSLLFPALAISSSPSFLVTSCHVSSLPPFSVLCSLLLPPSCPAICQPVLVSSHHWLAGNNRSLINTKYWPTLTLFIAVTV